MLEWITVYHEYMDDVVEPLSWLIINQYLSTENFDLFKTTFIEIFQVFILKVQNNQLIVGLKFIKLALRAFDKFDYLPN